MMDDKHVVIVGEIRAESKLNKRNFLDIIKDSCKDNKLKLRDDISKALNKLKPLYSNYFKSRVGWDSTKKSLLKSSHKYHIGIFKARELDYNIPKELRKELRDLVLSKTNIRI